MSKDDDVQGERTEGQAAATPYNLEEMDADILAGKAYLQLRTSSRARDIVLTEQLHVSDVHHMLRGQVLGNCFHCREIDPSTQIPQRHLGNPLDPVSFPHTRLQCPLEERYYEGDEAAPCSSIQDRRDLETKDADEDDRTTSLLKKIRREEIYPCMDLWQFAFDNLWVMLDLPADVYRRQRPPADEEQLKARRQELLEQALEDIGTQGVLRQIHFLVDSGRLDLYELMLLLDFSIYTTDSCWLPCRDDPDRTVFFRDIDDLHNRNGAAGLRCPIQARALLGDLTVPCVQAAQAQSEDLKRAAQEAFPNGSRPRPAQPRYWTQEDEAPGGPRDIVRRLRLRPCQLLGQLLAARLPEFLERVALDEDPLTAERVSGRCGGDEEDDEAEEGVWAGV